MPRGIERRVVATQAVVKHRARVRVARPPACGGLLGGGRDQLRRQCLLAAPGREQHPGIPQGRVPSRLGDQAILVEQQRRRGQLAGEDVASGKKTERELQVYQRARVAGKLYLASGQHMKGFRIPELDGNDDAGSSAGQPVRAAGLVVCQVQRQHQIECPGQRWRGRRVAVRHAYREPVEHDVDRTRRFGAGGRRTRGLGRLEHAARDLEIEGHPGTERLEVGLACQRGVERLEASGGAHEQPARVAAASLLQGDLPAQVLHLRGAQVVRRAGLDRDQQAECRVKCPGIVLGGGCREQALRATTRCGRQRRRALEECRRRGQAAAALGSVGGALQLLGDVLVGARRGLGAMPGAAVGIDLCDR